MIDLYTSATPNGQKIHIMLEECGLDYSTNFIDLDAGGQFDPEFLKISPNNKIPVILDRDGPGGAPLAIFESGAILFYLAEKTGRFLPTEPRARADAMQWLFWQVGGFGPMLGQAHHFRAYARVQIDYAIERYTNESHRLYQVLDRQLDGRDFVAGEYSIADMSIFPWCRLHDRQGQKLEDFPNVKRWYGQVAQRPAVAKDMARLEDTADKREWTDERWANLFGTEQHRRR